VCPVEWIDGQVPICGRYSRGTTISQQPDEAASVRGITDAEEGIVKIDQVTVKNSWGRLVFILDRMSSDLDDLQHISAPDREGWDNWIKTQYRY